MLGPDDEFGPAGVLVIVATFTNISGDDFSDVVLRPNTLTSGNAVILQTDEIPIGCQTQSYCEVGGTETLAPGESFNAVFEIGLQELRPFRFFVDVFDLDGRNRVTCPCEGEVNEFGVVWDETFMPTSCAEIDEVSGKPFLQLLNDNGAELSVDMSYGIGTGNACNILVAGSGRAFVDFSDIQFFACVASLRQIAAAAGVDCPQ